MYNFGHFERGQNFIKRRYTMQRNLFFQLDVNQNKNRFSNPSSSANETRFLLSCLLERLMRFETRVFSEIREFISQNQGFTSIFFKQLEFFLDFRQNKIF